MFGFLTYTHIQYILFTQAMYVSEAFMAEWGSLECVVCAVLSILHSAVTFPCKTKT